MAVTDINSVADYLLSYAQDRHDLITPFKLQKMVFYADAWYMALHDNTELIENKFEAWVHGPVARELYYRFKDYQWRPILEEITSPDNLPADVCDHLDEIYYIFGGYTASDLEEMTHIEEPWLQARGSLTMDEPCTNLIDKQLTARFYREMTCGHD